MTTSTRPALGPAAPSAVSRPRGAARIPVSRHPRSDDELIGYTLTTLWALETGRRLPVGKSAAQLSEQELITFWSDPALEHEGLVES
jgi:hypothetical protein